MHGLPIGWALTGAKADERHALADILAARPAPDTITDQGRQVGYAAHQPGGAVPGWWFLVVLVAFLVVLTLVTVRMFVGGATAPTTGVRSSRKRV